MRNFEQIFDDALRIAIKEAMDEPVGRCTTHGMFTRAEDHVFRGCPVCHERKERGLE